MQSQSSSLLCMASVAPAHSLKALCQHICQATPKSFPASYLFFETSIYISSSESNGSYLYPWKWQEIQRAQEQKFDRANYELQNTLFQHSHQY